ncbi:hypothetical protein NIES4071_11040 [Calothrix sp. NIES-4071]|nr:hypothetical protein NIES4071_11040 [Calothrix sp. NIES-4071]BAZ55444.1 hypothetical protein NIES4105_11000 [Calothrix sp. NIES-4105]
MYVIQATSLTGKTGYLYEVSNKGKRYLDFPVELFDAKQYKLKERAEAALTKYKNEKGANIRDIFVQEVTKKDIELARVDSGENALQSQIEYLNKEYSIDSKVLRPMERKLASTLVKLKRGDEVRYYIYIDRRWKYELVKIEEVRGSTLIVKDNQYKRINGMPEIQGTFNKILPDDDEIAGYFVGLGAIKAVYWDDINVDKIIRIAAILKENT